MLNESEENLRERIFEPDYVKKVLITLVNSEGSGEPEHLHSLARAFAVRTHKVWSDQKSDIKPHWMAAHGHLKNEFSEDEKYHNLMRWLICSVWNENSVGLTVWHDSASRVM